MNTILELRTTVYTYFAFSSTTLGSSAQKSTLIIINELGCTIPLVGEMTMGNFPWYSIANEPKDNKSSRLHLDPYNMTFRLLVRDRHILQSIWSTVAQEL